MQKKLSKVESSLVLQLTPTVSSGRQKLLWVWRWGQLSRLSSLPRHAMVRPVSTAPGAAPYDPA